MINCKEYRGVAQCVLVWMPTFGCSFPLMRLRRRCFSFFSAHLWLIASLMRLRRRCFSFCPLSPPLPASTSLLRLCSKCSKCAQNVLVSSSKRRPPNPDAGEDTANSFSLVWGRSWWSPSFPRKVAGGIPPVSPRSYTSSVFGGGVLVPGVTWRVAY